MYTCICKQPPSPRASAAHLSAGDKCNNSCYKESINEFILISVKSPYAINEKQFVRKINKSIFRAGLEYCSVYDTAPCLPNKEEVKYEIADHAMSIKNLLKQVWGGEEQER